MKELTTKWDSGSKQKWKTLRWAKSYSRLGRSVSSTSPQTWWKHSSTPTFSGKGQA